MPSRYPIDSENADTFSPAVPFRERRIRRLCQTGAIQAACLNPQKRTL
jgi:hypothetical protein